ncbi:MAG: nickel insertion protein [Victivallales bacterium]
MKPERSGPREPYGAPDSERDMVVVNLPCGAEVRVKRAFLDGRTISAKPEYEDCRKVSDEYGIPYREVFLAALNALEK